MSNYRFYQAIVDALLKAARENTKKIGKQDYTKAVELLMLQSPQLVHTLDFQIIIDEFRYLFDSNSSMYFVQDDYAVENIARVNIQKGIDLSKYIKNSEVFTLTFPTTSMYNGLLVSIGNFFDHERVIRKHFPYLLNNVKNDTAKYDSAFPKQDLRIAVSYTRDDATSPNAVSSYRTLLDPKHFGEVACVQTLQEFNDLYVKTDAPCLDLNQEEREHMWKIMSFVSKFLFYREASPHHIITGLPTKQTQPKLHWNVKHNKIFSFPKPEVERREQFRSASIHVLRNPRFYRGEYAHLNPGDRLVEVGSYVVNKKAKDINTVN